MNKVKDFAYSLGNFASAVLGQTVTAFAFFYYVDVLKVPAERISAIMVLYGVWNAINDPLFGHISDRTKTKWGRRIPYILFLTLPLCVAFALLWAPPFAAGNSQALSVYYLIVIFLFDGLFTIVVLNWTALFPEMYPRLEDRSRVSALRQVLGILGLIVGVALPPFLHPLIGWKAMGAVFAVLSLLTMYACLYGAKEKPEFSAEPGLGLWEALKATYINKSYVTYLIPALLVQYTFVGLQSAIPFYAKYVLGVQGLKESLLLGTLFVMAIPFSLVWAKIINRIGPKKAMAHSMALFGACLVFFFIAQNFIQAVATCFALSFGLAGILVLLDILIADVTDEDEIKTGVRREGMYFGVNGFMIRLGISINAAIMGPVMVRTGYDAGLAVQPASALTGFRLLMSVIPMAALGLALIVFRYYPLDGETLERVKAKVAAMHREKAAE
ncbi:MAG: MFS transporter [Bacillota bacterium]